MKIFKITTWLGIIMIIGTAGSSDIGYISFSNAVAQLFSGVLISLASYVLYVATYRPKIKLKHRKIVPIEELRKVG